MEVVQKLKFLNNPVISVPTVSAYQAVCQVIFCNFRIFSKKDFPAPRRGAQAAIISMTEHVRFVVIL
jgi:hypothetical protein